MQHIDSLAVLGKVICPMLDEQTDEAHVAMESTEVQWSEAVVASAMGVQPRFQNLLLLLLITFENNALIAGRSAVSIS